MRTCHALVAYGRVFKTACIALRTLLALTACKARVTWEIFFTLRMRKRTSRVFGITQSLGWLAILLTICRCLRMFPGHLSIWIGALEQAPSSRQFRDQF